MRTLTIVAIILGLAGASADVQAEIDAPGGLSFEFGAPASNACTDLKQVEGEEVDATWAQAYFSSQASSFGERGLLIWSSFQLEGPDGLRQATLLLDLDPDQGRDRESPLPPSAWTARYFETRDDGILFEADFIAGEVGLLSLMEGEDDEGQVEGWFQLLITDSRAVGPACRILLDGRFASRGQSPAGSSGVEHPADYGSSADSGCESSAEADDVVFVGCDAVADSDDGYDEGGCGGYDDGADSYDSYDGSSGCDGDSTDSYDSYDSSSGCDGDSYDSDDSSDWDSDAGGDCAGDAEAAVSVLRPVRRRLKGQSDLLGRILRFFPEICAGLFIAFMRKRQQP